MKLTVLTFAGSKDDFEKWWKLNEAAFITTETCIDIRVQQVPVLETIYGEPTDLIGRPGLRRV